MPTLLEKMAAAVAKRSASTTASTPTGHAPVSKTPTTVHSAALPIPLGARIAASRGEVSNPAIAALFDQRKEVGPSFDLDRIVALPRRVLDLDKYPVEPMTQRLRTSEGTMVLRPVQAAALAEIETYGGLLGPIGVGEGKTLITLLAPTVLKSKTTVLLVPPQLRVQLSRDIPTLAKHWQIHTGAIHVVPYSMLSSAKHSDILEQLSPDLIISDEAHTFATKDSARSKRFNRYMGSMPETRFVALSGTITTHSLRDYYLLSALALDDGSPLPLYWPTLLEWSQAIDPVEMPIPMGALKALCTPGEDVRSGFRRRLRETPGVVGTNEDEVLASLNIISKTISLGVKSRTALQKLRTTWCTPGGEELEDTLAFHRAARQLACGFYYKWDWPKCRCGGEKSCFICSGSGHVTDEAWLFARKEWHKEMREFLSHHSRPGMDSPLLLARAAATGKWASETWENWTKVKDRPIPSTVAIWTGDEMINDAVAWGKKHKGLIWYESDALGTAIAQSGGFIHCGPGESASRKILELSKAQAPVPVVVSSKAHATGKNLQLWSENLILQPPANGAAWEQLMGRTHRLGQNADEVNVYVYQHTVELQNALKTARADAEYIETSTGQRQKLRKATFVGHSAS